MSGGASASDHVVADCSNRVLCYAVCQQPVQIPENGGGGGGRGERGESWGGGEGLIYSYLGDICFVRVVCVRACVNVSE